MYYRIVSKIYDEDSLKYDKIVLKNYSYKLSYLLSLSYLLNNFKEGQNVLDIGCGTGLQAIPLALHGCNVVAVDVSKGMLEILRRKIEKFSIKNIKIYNMAASKVSELKKTFGKEYFDGAYSYYGPINTEPNIIRLRDGVFDLLKKGGLFIVMPINRWCLYDIVTGKPRRAYGIFRDFKFRYYTPLEIKKLFSYFKVEEIYSLSILTPHVNSKIKDPRIINFLFSIDKHIYKTFPFKYLGTDFLIKFRK